MMKGAKFKALVQKLHICTTSHVHSNWLYVFTQLPVPGETGNRAMCVCTCSDVNSPTSTSLLLSSHLMVDSSIILLGFLLPPHIPLVSSSHQQEGKTPVYIASEHGHKAIVKMLIEAKADVNHPNEVWDEYCNQLLHWYVCVMYTSLEWREGEEVM